jgi:hypothetical protein
MNAIDILRQMKIEYLRQKYSTVPPEYIPAPHYTEKTANGITRMIIDWIKLNHGQAERVSCQGRIIDKRQQIIDCLGYHRMIGTVKRIPSSMTKGTADISATVKGRSIKIEVKVGHDRQSDAQVRYQRQVEQAGGVYFIARNFDDFIKFWEGINAGN